MSHPLSLLQAPASSRAGALALAVLLSLWLAACGGGDGQTEAAQPPVLSAAEARYRALGVDSGTAVQPQACASAAADDAAPGASPIALDADRFEYGDVLNLPGNSSMPVAGVVLVGDAQSVSAPDSAGGRSSLALGFSQTAAGVSARLPPGTGALAPGRYQVLVLLATGDAVRVADLHIGVAAAGCAALPA